jgi:hypothetical protein
MEAIKELELRDAIALAVNSFDAGIETKQDTIQQIYNYVEGEYIKKKAIEALPAEVLSKLNESHGISLDVRAGSLKDIKVEKS